MPAKGPLCLCRKTMRGRALFLTTIVIAVLLMVTVVVPFLSISLWDNEADVIVVGKGTRRQRRGKDAHHDIDFRRPGASAKDPKKSMRAVGHNEKTLTFDALSFTSFAASVPELATTAGPVHTTIQNPTTTTSRHLPYFVIHAGPDKTGTTSIQNFLQQHTQEILEKDKYDVSFSKGSLNKINRYSAAFLLDCFIFPKHASRPCHQNPRLRNKALQNVEAFWNQTDFSVGRQTTDLQTPSILWSTEGFRWAKLGLHYDWPWFVQQIQPHYQSIQFVVVYRRYFDWLTSRYNEDHRSSEYAGFAFLRWPDDPRPDGGGIAIPTFEEYWHQEKTGTCPTNNARGQKDCDNFLANRIRMDSTEDQKNKKKDGDGIVAVHPLLEMTRPLLEDSRNANIAIQVLNFHGEHDILEAFFCDAVPISPVLGSNTGINSTAAISFACLEAKRQVQAKCEAQELQQQQQEADADLPQQVDSGVVGGNHREKRRQRLERYRSRTSDVIQIQYDRIALEAHRMGLVNWNVTRNAVRHQVELYLTRSKDEDTDNGGGDHYYNDPLSWVCPSKEILEELEQASFRFEQEVLQNLARQRRQGQQQSSLTFRESHADAFAKALQAKKFCSVNTTRLLEDAGLRSILANLTESSLNKKSKKKGGKRKKKKQQQIQLVS